MFHRCPHQLETMSGFNYTENADNLERTFKGVDNRHTWCRGREIDLILKRRDMGTFREQVNLFWNKEDAEDAIIPGYLVSTSPKYEI